MQTNNKLREALVNIQNLADALDLDEPNVIAILDTCRDALAAPPRNCDIYSHDEALNIWAAETENERNGCFDEWLYHDATEKEGGDK